MNHKESSTVTAVKPAEGFVFNARGWQIPESDVKEIDKLRDEVILDILNKAKELQHQMLAYKTLAMTLIADFTDLSASEYGVEYGGAKGNVQLVSFNGKYKVQRSIADLRVFDERIQAAKTKIDSCIERWSEGSNDQIKALVDFAFRVSKQGHIDTNQVLSLRQLNIDDPEWLEAMDAIADSIQVIGKTPYLRIYERQGDGSFKQLALDIAKL